MSHALTTIPDTATPTATPQRDRASKLAGEFLKQNAFVLYQQGKAKETLRRQWADLALFVTFLTELEYPRPDGRESGGFSSPLLFAHLTLYWLQVDAMIHDAQSWEGIEHGLLVMYQQWQFSKGYTVGSVNVRISTVRKYASLAQDAGVISFEEMALIQKKVKTIDRKGAMHIDQARDIKRIGKKKEHAVLLTTEQVERLFAACPATPQGARDSFLLTLLFRYGLRCGEVAGLTLVNYQRRTGVLTFYRPKTDDYNTLHLELEDRARVDRYYDQCMPESEAINPARCVVMGGNNKGQIFGTMGERSITGRVNTLGKRILGVENLSGHDGRHYSATEAVAGGTDIFTLMGIYNWTSTQTPTKYVDAAKVSNQNMKRGRVE